MTEISKLRELLERVEGATGPDREIDKAISKALLGETSMAPLTRSIDCAVELCERVLPGWGWSVCRCCVSDDARVWPDYNCHEHGERLKREFPLPAERYLETNARGATELTWGPYDTGFDIDRRPPGNVALALCEAILQAKLYIAEQAGT